MGYMDDITVGIIVTGLACLVAWRIVAKRRKGGENGSIRMEFPDSQPRNPQVRGTTEVAVSGDMFMINGKPAYKGRTWRGRSIEGLLMNARLVQGIFDDLNPETRGLWAYPDTGKWDPDRNTQEFIGAMPGWRDSGLLAFTINLQGGMPKPFTETVQPWHNSALTENGELRPEYMARLGKILDRADELGMVVVLGVYYFGQDHRLRDEQAVKTGLDNAVDWILDGGWRNILLEVNNECDVHYRHPILQPERVDNLIIRAQNRRRGMRRLLVGTSYGGGQVPRPNVVETADFLLLHGNGVEDPNRISEMVRDSRCVRGYAEKPVMFNEDDHYGFDRDNNNMASAVAEYAGWGYYDQGEGNYRDGFQSPPVNWGMSSERKKAFFEAVREITGGGT